MPIRALYPGTFDPITLGHTDVITEALRIFDEVTIAVLENPAKTHMFSVEQRVEMIKAAAKELGLNRIKIAASELMTVEVAASVGARTIVRGVRLNTDFEQELFLCMNNKALEEEISTVFIPPHQEHLHISSTAVREIIRFGRHHALVDYLPHEVYKLVMKMKREVTS